MNSTDIFAATESYESWLGQFVKLNQSDLAGKHKQMADADDPFSFFRGTYYRWVQRWTEAAGDLANTPVVPSIGDLHVENFGTWRDVEGRLCWGVHDFGEADKLPYPFDLVRLAGSVWFAKQAGGLDLKFDSACGSIAAGYRDGLMLKGDPFVLEERFQEMWGAELWENRQSRIFWEKVNRQLSEPVNPPDDVRVALLAALPAEALSVQFCVPPPSDVGDLGKPGYLALTVWGGSRAAREARPLPPPTSAWAAGRTRGACSLADEVLERAIRSPDPFHRVVSGWVIRRLGPQCSRINVAELKHAWDVDRLLRAMGMEVANVHLGGRGVRTKVLEDFSPRGYDWLEQKTRSMCKLLEKDWVEWRKDRNDKRAATTFASDSGGGVPQPPTASALQGVYTKGVRKPGCPIVHRMNSSSWSR